MYEKGDNFDRMIRERERDNMQGYTNMIEFSRIFFIYFLIFQEKKHYGIAKKCGSDKNRKLMRVDKHSIQLTMI